MIHNLYYILLVDDSYLTLDIGKIIIKILEDPKDIALRRLMNSLIRRNLFHMSYYIIAYLPNNFVFLITYFFKIPSIYNYFLIHGVILLISFNCCFSILVELTDPFMRKYLKTYYFSRRRYSSSSRSRDSCENFHDLENFLNPLNEANKIEMDHIKTEETPENKPYDSAKTTEEKQLSLRHQNTFDRFSLSSVHSDDISNKINVNRKTRYHNSLFYLSHGARAFELMNSHLEFSESIQRMIGISISINEDRIYDKDEQIKMKFLSRLPWPEEEIYQLKTNFQEYRQNNLPDWVNIKYEKKFQFLKISIKKFSPLIFHHIRVIDKISVDDCINSLDPILNLKMIRESKVAGGRSPNSILFTWDKKMLIKTISKSEKQLLVKRLLKDYHKRMRDTKSLLCRIYGLFRIKIGDNIDSYVVLMKNMIDLPLETKILTFDLKGSTADRECIVEQDKQKEKSEITKIYRQEILKDKDLTFLNVEFDLSSSDAKNLITAIEKDSIFLENYWITDYSLLTSIHKFKTEDYRAYFKNLRVIKSTDDKYLFCFSIIDFLTVKLLFLINFRPITLKRREKNLLRIL